MFIYLFYLSHLSSLSISFRCFTKVNSEIKIKPREKLVAATSTQFVMKIEWENEKVLEIIGGAFFGLLSL